jgi:hypothetical protein
MMALHSPVPHSPDHDALRARLDALFDELHRRLDALDRRFEQRIAELRIKQEEELMLLKAMSCQLRGRVERVERRRG